MNQRRHNALSTTTSSTRSRLDLSALQSTQTSLFALKAISKQKDILPKCRQLFQILTLLTDSCQPNEHFTDFKAQTFFFSEFLISNTQFILECSAVDNHEMEIMLNSCLKQTLKLVTTHKTHIEEFYLWQVLELILNPKQPYYQCNSHQKESPLRADVQSITQNEKETQGTKNIGFSFSEVFRRILVDTPCITNNNKETAHHDNQKQVSKSVGFYFFEILRKDIRDAKFLDMIYNLSKNRDLSFNGIFRICSIINHLSDSFSKCLPTEYLIKVNEAISDSIVNNTGSYGDSEDGFTDENIKVILKRVKTFLIKASDSSEEQKHKACDIFKLHIAILCLSSKALNNSKWGILIVNDVVSKFKRSESTGLNKSLSKPACDQLLCSVLKKISENKSENHTSQFGSCSLKLLSYMFNRNLFGNVTELKILWNYLKELTISNIFLLQRILYKIFKGCPCSDFKIFSGIINERIDKQGLKILYLINQSYSKNKTLTRIFQSILEENDGISKEEWYKEVFKNYKISYRSSIGYKEPLDHIEGHILAARKNLSKFGPFRMIILWAEEVLKTEDNGLIQRLLKIYTEKNVLELFLTYLRGLDFHLIKIYGKGHAHPNQISQVSEQIAFLEHLLYNQLPEKPVLTCEILCKLWEIFVEKPRPVEEKTLFFQAMTRVNNSKNRLCLPEGDMQKFSQRKIAIEKTKVDLISIEEARSFFISFFLAMNEKSHGKIWRPCDTEHFTVKVAPDELEGFDTLFDLTMSGIQQFLNFFGQVYESIEDRLEPDLPKIRKRLVNRCFTYIQKNFANKTKEFSHKCLAALLIIQQIMDNSQRSGMGDLMIHSELRKSEPIQIRVITREFHEDKEIKVVLESNDSVFEILKAVARFLKPCWDEIELFKLDSKKEKVSYNQLGKTLMDAGIENGQLLYCCPRKIPKVDLLRDHNEMNPRAEKTFRGLFEEYSDNGKMSLEQFASFCNIEINGLYPPLGDDMINISDFSHYNIDRDGYLTVDNFLQFWLSMCQKDPYYTWEVLHANKKRNDLKEKAEIENQTSKRNCLAAYIISSDPQHFQTLYSLLELEELIASRAWILLTQLPTHPDIFRNILELKGVRGIQDPSKRYWNSLLDPRFKYKLLYALNIVEYLMHYSLTNSKIMPIEDAKLMKYQKAWQADFVNYGGLDYLCQVFVLFWPNSFKPKTEAHNRVFDFARVMRNKLSERDQMILGVRKDKMNSISEFVNLANQYEKDFIKVYNTYSK